MSFTVEEDRALPLVQFSVVSQNGSVLDPPGKEGLTRLTTRMMRRSAHGLDANQVDERLDGLGASLGIDVSHSAAGFSGAVLTRSLDAYVELLRGVLLAPALPEAELQLLRRETLAEITEQKDDDRALARSWFRRRLFAGHPYGRSVTGTAESIRSITLDDVRWAYERIFERSAFSVGLAGDIGVQEAKDVALKVIPRGAADRTREPAPEAPGPLTSPRVVIVDKPERTQTQILIGCLGTRATDEDHTPLVVANTVFGGAFSARLMQAVRAERGWSYGAYSSLPIDRARQAFSMWTFPKAEDCAPCVELELGMLREWVSEGITAEELSWAQNYLVRSHVFSTDTAAKRLALTQDEILLDLPKGYNDRFPERVRAVTLEQANAAVRSRIALDRLLIVILGTASDIATEVGKVVPPEAEVEVVRWDES